MSDYLRDYQRSALDAIRKALVEVEAALPKVVWIPDLHEIDKAAPVINFKAYQGHADGWKFLIVGIDVPGDDPVRQYHGTAVKLGIILKLAPDLARKAGEKAETPL